MKRPFNFQWLRLGLLALAGVTAVLSLTRADEPLRLSRNVAGDSKPVLVDADDIITWVDGKYRIVVLKGQVLVQQGVVESRFDQGVIRIDMENYEKQHILHVELFADGNVKLANGPDKSEGGKAVVELNTRGEFKLNAHKNKVVQQAKPDDPVYKRILGGLAAPADKPAPKSTKSETGKPAPAAPDPVQRTSYQEIPRQTPPVQPVKPAQRPSPPPPSSELPPLPELPRLPPGPAPPGSIAATPGPPDLPVPDVPDPPPPTRGPGPSTAVPLLPGQTPLAAGNPVRQFSVTPRTAAGFKGPYARVINGERVVVVLGGVIVTVTGGPNNETLDIEADSLILWSHDYDINRHVAIAISADLQFRQPGVPIPIHFKADELM